MKTLELIIDTFFVTFKFDEMDDNLRKPRERYEFGHLSQICCLHVLVLGISYNDRKKYQIHVVCGIVCTVIV